MMSSTTSSHGQPIASKFRKLDGEKLAAAKAELFSVPHLLGPARFTGRWMEAGGLAGISGS
jgi:hypothetical protein